MTGRLPRYSIIAWPCARLINATEFAISLTMTVITPLTVLLLASTPSFCCRIVSGAFVFSHSLRSNDVSNKHDVYRSFQFIRRSKTAPRCPSWSNMDWISWFIVFISDTNSFFQALNWLLIKFKVAISVSNSFCSDCSRRWHWSNTFSATPIGLDNFDLIFVSVVNVSRKKRSKLPKLLRFHTLSWVGEVGSTTSGSWSTRPVNLAAKASRADMGMTMGWAPSKALACSVTYCTTRRFSAIPWSPPVGSKMSILLRTTMILLRYWTAMDSNRARSDSGNGRSAEVTKMIKSAAGNMRIVRAVWSVSTAFVPGVSTMVRSRSNGSDGTGWYMTSPILLLPLLAVGSCSPITVKVSTFCLSTTFGKVSFCESFSVYVGKEEEIMVIPSVVGKAPVFSNLDPINALMTVDFPALYSPAMTTTNVFWKISSMRRGVVVVVLDVVVDWVSANPTRRATALYMKKE